MKYKLVADSSANLLTLDAPFEYASVPLTLNAGDKSFIDDANLDVKEMVDFLSSYKGKSGSACPSVADWLNAFGDADRIICFTITSGLSGSYNAAHIAKNDYEAEYPDRKVFVLDSLSAGSELKLHMEKAIELIQVGIDFHDLCIELHNYAHNHCELIFCLESLNNLANNGRVSPLVAKVAGVLGIRVYGRASNQGQLEQKDKCRGEKKALIAIHKYMKELGYTSGKVRIDHCFNEGAALQLKDMILKECPSADVVIEETRGLCSFYAEQGGLMVGFEVVKLN